MATRLNPLPYSSRMQKAEVAKSLSQDGTLAYTSDPLIANFDNESISQNSSECQCQKDLKGESNITTTKMKNHKLGHKDFEL